MCCDGHSWDGKKADVGYQVFPGFEGKVFCKIFNVDPTVMAVPAIERDDVVSINVVCPVEKNRRLAFVAVPADIDHYRKTFLQNFYQKSGPKPSNMKRPLKGITNFSLIFQ